MNCYKCEAKEISGRAACEILDESIRVATKCKENGTALSDRIAWIGTVPTSEIIQAEILKSELLASMNARDEAVKELIAASKKAVCSLGECTTTLEICEAIFKLERGTTVPPAAKSCCDTNQVAAARKEEE